MIILRWLLIIVAISFVTAGSAVAEQEFCWRDSETRGVGTIPKICPNGSERIGLFCYKKCPENTKRFGFDCHSVCPSGMRDDGLFCRAAEYGRGAGYAAWHKKKCNQNHKDSGGCEWWGAMLYPKCKPGYSPFGCCICRPNKPDCNKLGLNPGVDLSCAKKVIIGDPKIAECKSGEEMDAGLCYRRCKKGYTGVGPVCWGNAPEGWVDCGMGAAKDKKTCAEIISDQVISVGNMALSIATLGSSSAASKSGSTASKAGKFSKLKNKFNKLKKGVEKVKDLPEVKDILKANEYYENGKTYVDGLGQMSEAKTEEDMIRAAATMASILDPSGVSDVVAAYTYPKCSKYGLSPKGSQELAPESSIGVVASSSLNIDITLPTVQFNFNGKAGYVSGKIKGLPSGSKWHVRTWVEHKGVYYEAGVDTSVSSDGSFKASRLYGRPTSDKHIYVTLHPATTDQWGTGRRNMNTGGRPVSVTTWNKFNKDVHIFGPFDV